jgi:quercetin dioxygenase-like cupin family protein
MRMSALSLPVHTGLASGVFYHILDARAADMTDPARLALLRFVLNLPFQRGLPMEQQQPTAAEPSGPIQKARIIAETSNLRVSEFTLRSSESLPWHHHSEVDDTFYCLEGLIDVETRQPAQRFVLRPGEKCVVPAKTVHRSGNAANGTSRYLLIQGVGHYDFVKAS